MSTGIYIAVMAGVTYIIRMIPFTFFTKKIKSEFVRSFLHYIPYAVLSAMTLPAILYSTGDMMTAAVGTVVAVILAYFGCPLIVVALAASLAAYIAGLF
ncbi:MAG: AzlD domain-containing protein [Ruminococcus sp.]|jgi:branched-subunit amino acid transport protein|nr:AzlD domain-containing protein [Ruminococcus sp.]